MRDQTIIGWKRTLLRIARQLGEPDVVAPPRGAPLLIAEVGFLDRRDDRPVTTNRAMLHSPPPEPKRLHRNSGNPDRREEVAVSATDHDVAAEPVAPDPQRDRLQNDSRDDGNHASTVGIVGPLSKSAWIRRTTRHVQPFYHANDCKRKRR